MFASHKTLPLSTVIVQDANLLPQTAGAAEGWGQDSEISMACCTKPLAPFLEYCSRLAPCIGVARAETLEQLKEDKLPEILRDHKGVRLLLIGGAFDEEDIVAVLSMGCWGVLRSATDSEEVTEAVRAVSRDEIWASRRLLTKMFRRVALSDTQKLSRRELEILTLLAHETTNKALAESLSISPETLRWHLRNLYSKTGIHERRSLIAYAKELAATSGAKAASAVAGS